MSFGGRCWEHPPTMLLLVVGDVPVFKESMLSYNTGLKASCSSAAFEQQSGVESTEKMSHPGLHHGACP